MWEETQEKEGWYKILDLYMGHLRTFFQSFFPPENASKHGRQAIPSGDTVTSDPKPVFQKWIGGGLSAREFSKVHQILKISLESSKIPTY